MREQTPRDWPALLSDEVCGDYIGVTGRTVRTLTSKGLLPRPIAIPQTTCKRWVRSEVDAAIERWAEDAKR